MLTTAVAVNPQHPEQFIEIQHSIAEPAPWELLVKVKAVSINPVDTKVHARLINNGLQHPRILGWDASGVVQAVGSAVTQFAPGDEVWYAGDITRDGSNATHQLVDCRLAAHKPDNLNWAQAAAMPLTALTAWEGLFEHLQIQHARQGQTLLIIGGAGGVGSLAIPFAMLRSQVKIIATASRPESVAWCRERGAERVVNHHNLLQDLHEADIKQVDYIFCLSDTDGHWNSMADLIAPFGHICCIVENQGPLDQSKIRSKSASLHWEFMFTRSMYQTPDMMAQGHILHQVAGLVERGKLQSTLSNTLQGLSIANIEAGHRQILQGHMRGKLVVQY